MFISLKTMCSFDNHDSLYVKDPLNSLFVGLPNFIDICLTVNKER